MVRTKALSLEDAIHSLRSQVVATDKQGIIHAANQAWITAGMHNGRPANFDWAGQDYFQYLHWQHRGDDLLLRKGFRDVSQGDLHFHRQEYFRRHCAGNDWFLLEITPFIEPHSMKISGLVISHTNITDYKNRECWLVEALTAMSSHQQVQDMLPVCAVCKSIKDEANHWLSLEDYLFKHTHVDCTHDICPNCIRRLYPGYSSILDHP
ncbi:hypothetical protein [Paenibacillus massiliensis]|uniref:hypothetical protein n=1 Tax=Paenibacillus massiliensis TaxID=225917 RepID=UPI00046E6255|nr:hypothetical protein [Paenibacillus massiliensis]